MGGVVPFVFPLRFQGEGGGLGGTVGRKYRLGAAGVMASRMSRGGLHLSGRPTDRSLGGSLWWSLG